MGGNRGFGEVRWAGARAEARAARAALPGGAAPSGRGRAVDLETAGPGILRHDDGGSDQEEEDVFVGADEALLGLDDGRKGPAGDPRGSQQVMWAGVGARASSGGAGAPYRGAAPCVGGEGGTPGNGAGAGEDDESRGGSGALGGGGGGTPGTPAAVEAALIPLRPLASAYTAYKEGLGEARAALEIAGAAYGEAEAAYRSALPATKASTLNVAVGKLGEDAAAKRATVGHLARNDAPRKALAEVLQQAADVLQLAESRHREASGAEAALRRALENTGATPALLRRLLPAAALDGWISTPEGEEGIPPPPDPPAPPPPGGAIVPRDLDGSFSAEQMRTELKSIAESAATAAAQSVLERDYTVFGPKNVTKTTFKCKKHTLLRENVHCLPKRAREVPRSRP